MIKGIGNDIIEIARFQALVAKGDDFAKKVLTPAEFAQYQQLSDKRKAEYLGGRWGIKESFAKALGTGIGKAVALQDIETLWDENGAPVPTVKGYPGKIFSTIAHDNHEISTFVVLEE